jgi:acylphosphatase
MKAKKMIIHGLVQGVFFRAGCVKKANELDCKGTVQNLPNKTVEVIIMDNIINNKNTTKLINWCKQGPKAARVDSIDIEEIEIEKEFNDFIRLN